MNEYVCPKCGARVDVAYLMSYPGQTRYKCTRCDYEKTIRDEIKQVKAPV